MPVFTRDTLPALLGDLGKQTAKVYVLFGERYLCQSAAFQIESGLLKPGGTLHHIDGDQEDISATLVKLRSFSLLPGCQLYKVTDTRLFHSKQVAKSIWERAVKAHRENHAERASRALHALIHAGDLNPAHTPTLFEALSPNEWQQCFGFSKPTGDLSWTGRYLEQDNGAPTHAQPLTTDPGEALLTLLETGIPQSNILLLLAEEVDKRKKIFKRLKEEQVIVDLSVESGASTKAQKEQTAVLQELIRKTLAEQQKSMAPGLADILLERVGFHPVAVVMEIRKLMLSLGDRRQITREDLDALVGRTRQEALFELTTAIGKRDTEQVLAISGRLHENGIHPLAVVATLRNFARGLLLFRTLQSVPGIQFRPTMTAAQFQQNCLPQLKNRSQWQKELSGHPYALYMQFKTAADYSLTRLCSWMKLLLEAEIRLKGSSLDDTLIVQQLLLAMLTTPLKR